MSSSVYVKLPSAETDIRYQIVNCTQTNISDVSALIKQILKGSKSSETLGQAHRIFASIDPTISNSSDTFHKISALTTHIGYQEEAIEKSIRLSETVQEQLNSIKLVRPR